MKKVIITSGPPGSGKSYFARTYVENSIDSITTTVISTDNFFMVDDEYVFDVTKIAAAHSDCYVQYLNALFSDVDQIIVDNTNIHFWEREKFIVAARKLGWEVHVHFFIVKTFEQAAKCVERNVHGVPQDVILRMCFEHETSVIEEQQLGVRILNRDVT